MSARACRAPALVMAGALLASVLPPLQAHAAEPESDSELKAVAACLPAPQRQCFADDFSSTGRGSKITRSDLMCPSST